MNQLRSHTARLTVIVLLCAGFSLYMARSAQANQSSQAFTLWFSTMTKSAGTADLQQELNHLSKSGGHWDKLIKKASQIISRNNEDFNFPFAESTASQQVYQLLLIEWNQFQTGNEMAGIPAQPNVKLLSPLNFDTLGTSGITAAKPVKSHLLAETQNLNVVQQTNYSNAVIPMSSGIAICAP